jgi:hypothetical protein
MLTAVAPFKYCPSITTEEPLPAVVGLKAVITGLYNTVNAELEIAVPPDVTTVILPVSPFPNTTVIWVEELIVKLAAAVPPKLTAVAPVKFVPLITTEVPLGPDAGLKLVIDGLERKVKVLAEVVVPPDVVMLIIPVEPVPTTARIWVAESTVKLAAAVPPKLTAVAPVKLVPFIVTVAPLAPKAGENEPITGAAVVPDILK